MLNVQTFNRTNIARFGSGGVIMRSQSPLDNDTIARAAPSVFAEGKHESRSDRYTYIPTSQLLEGLRTEGFMPYEVRQGGSRDAVKRNFTKHMIRLRHEAAVSVGDSFREVILLNSHDGTSSYQLMSGVFRMVCSNGLVCAEGEAQMIRVPHKGDIVSQVIEGAYQIIDQGAAIDSQISDMRSLQLTHGEQEVFAEASLALRYDAETAPDIAPSQINAVRRNADQGDDLWRTFNRAQENLIRGGVNYVHRNANGQRSSRETRPVNSIEGNLSLNRALWTLATRMQELKAA